MADLGTHALIDFDYYLQFSGIDGADTTDLKEDWVNVFINAASSQVENFCRRKFRYAEDEEEIFGGDGDRQYFTKNRPIVGTPVIYYWNGTSWAEATAAVYPRAIEADKGRIYFTQGDVFGRGVGYYKSDNWKVKYDYGYEEIADIPDDLKWACAVLVQRMILKAQKSMEGKQSESFGNTTITYNLGTLPADVQDVLGRKYRRVMCG